MRQGNVFYKDHLAGVITETNEGEYVFQYDDQYVKDFPDKFITFTMPVTSQPYIDKRLFPFFDGLIPEGWLLDVALRNTDISILDRMSLLLTCCKDCIGAISVVPIERKEESHV